ncbi:hypothetical protein SAMN05660489_05735 [Pseudomonas sp. LAMO17WK12:I10]|uniref:hypothetical protein n=1 Tax=unclassified Pseudomonas TaxID=196821 RepID=UPI000BD80175|nr:MULTISPECIES: hypothetical protein [unclassified Pseudomonas]PXX54698.1 hypothetical protein H160_05730 [Pseudomonas sp. LAMO17WK12:I9]SNY51583.1 hypothetical protein SAMN05660489_05735 [Pseudomonas sp. LAMO17WK12:I10]
MSKFAVLDDYSVKVESGHPRQTAEAMAGLSLIVPLKGIDPEWNVYACTDQQEAELLGLQTYEEQSAYCKERLEWLIGFSRP